MTLQVIAFLSAWYAVGALGAFFVLFFGFVMCGLDVRLSDAAFGAALALFGPLAFIVGILCMAGYLVSRLSERLDDPVIMRGR